MSARTIAAAAVMTAAFAGPATAQHPMPRGDAPGGSPYYAGGPEMPPGMPGPMTGGGCAPGGPLDDISKLRGPQAWLGAEYLLYWTKHMPISAPLATGGQAAGFATLGTLMLTDARPKRPPRRKQGRQAPSGATPPS